MFPRLTFPYWDGVPDVEGHPRYITPVHPELPGVSGWTLYQPAFADDDKQLFPLWFDQLVVVTRRDEFVRFVASPLNTLREHAAPSLLPALQAGQGRATRVEMTRVLRMLEERPITGWSWDELVGLWHYADFIWDFGLALGLKSHELNRMPHNLGAFCVMIFEDRVAPKDLYHLDQSAMADGFRAIIEETARRTIAIAHVPDVPDVPGLGAIAEPAL